MPNWLSGELVLEPLVFILLALNLDLQAKWIFTSAIFIQVAIWGTSFCINYTCLQLICFGSSGSEVSLLFLETHACKMSKLVASLTLTFFCWTLESLYVGCISLFGTSVLIIVCTFGFKPLLVLGLCLIILTALLLVVWLLLLHSWSFLLIFACWQLCALVSERLICTACGSPATCFMWHTVALELSSF